MSRLQDWGLPIARIANRNLRPRWHPKITIYRLLILSTTIGLGTAKAIATYQHKSYVSTTIEWISGVAVFLIFFLVGLVEGDSSQTHWYRWLLHYDTLELLWSIFNILGLSRPRYVSDEKRPDPSSSESSGHHPPITGFRILTSSAVALFGMTKAYLSYGGFSNATTALDWISGVVLTSSLYCLGLYENNTTNKMPYLFSTNYNALVFSWGWLCFQITLYIIGMAFGVVWSLGWHHILGMFSDSPIDFRIIYDGTPSEGPPSFLGHIHDLSMEYMFEGFLWFVVFMGPALFLLSLWRIVSLLGQLHPIKRFARVVRHLTLALALPIRHFLSLFSYTLPSWAEGTLAHISTTYRFIRRFGIHIAVFTCATAICAVPAFFFMGFPLRIFFPTQTKAEFVTNLIVGILYIFIAGGIGGGCCLGMLFSACCLIAPFLMDWNSPQYERTLLEL